MIIRNIYDAIRSGYVRRWHSNPEMVDCDERLAAHQWEVAIVALRIYPHLSRAGIIKALTHDVGELRAGDLSYGFKSTNRKIAKVHGDYESECRREIIAPCYASRDASTMMREGVVIKVADRLVAYHQMLRHMPHLRFRDEWKSSLLDCQNAVGDGEFWGNISGWVEEIQKDAELRDGRSL